MEVNTCCKSSQLKRKGEVEEISQFLDESTKYLTDIINSLSWDIENTKNIDLKFSKCIHDENHLLQPRYLKKHLSKCKLKKSGITETCESSCFFYQSSSNVISHLEQSEVVWPANILFSEFTSEQRLEDYNKTVEIAKTKQKSTKQLSDQDITATNQEQEDNEHQFKSKLEMMAEQRDYKRRRQSYRAKNVHITKRSPTDIMREIIENQMKELEDSFRKGS